VRTVGAYEAKTNLSQLLDEVAAGRVVTITRHGQEVARLVPPPGRSSPEEVIAELRTARNGVRRGRSAVRSMIDEGRR
jgi:prevent-host-death family protein